MYYRKAVEATQLSPTILYKPQGSEPSQKTPGLGENDFILVLQTPIQEDMLLNFGSNIICMDDTHGTNSYDFSLFTFLVVVEYRESFPAACTIELTSTSLLIYVDYLMVVWIKKNG